MAFEMRDNSGSLFVNQRKQQPNHPDFTGKIMVGGVSWRLSAWKKQTKDGKSYLSLSVRELTGEHEERDNGNRADPFDLDR
jgi:hypothetical protein